MNTFNVLHEGFNFYVQNFVDRERLVAILIATAQRGGKRESGRAFDF